MVAIASVQGAWGATVTLPIIPVAVGLLPNGNMIAWSSDSDTSFEGDIGTAPSHTLAAFFNPLTGYISKELDTGVKADMFCPGIAYLADGRILVNGGSSSYHTALYDPFHGTFGTWSDSGNMNIPRGYNGSVTLSNGKVFTIGGSWSGGAAPKDGELWDPATGTWSLTGISDNAVLSPDDIIDKAQGYISFGDNHPWLFAMPGGKVFDAGPARQMNIIDPAAGTVTPVGTRGDDQYSINGDAVMYAPGLILKVGGAQTYTGGYDPVPGVYNSSASAYVIDIRADYTDPTATPTVTHINDMNHARAFSNAVVLPDGEVFIVGGQSHPKIFSDSDAVMTPEMWNPGTQKFTDLAPMPVPRDYHSTALLLPDGSVFVGGGGQCGGCASNFVDAGLSIPTNLPDGDHPDYNIYKPAYLFNADGSLAARPTISSAPGTLVLGNDLVVSASADTVAFSMVRFAATTHDVDTDQRRITLTINSNQNGVFDLSAPSDPGITVPGYYMLFAINAHGTPSMAATVQVEPVGGVPPVPTPNPPPVPNPPPSPPTPVTGDAGGPQGQPVPPAATLPSPPASPGGLSPSAPNFTLADLTTGQTRLDAGTKLPGGVTLFAAITTDSLNIAANVPSAFIQSGSGSDILSAAAGGNNVLDDTGGQVNFEIGGAGAGTDLFFLDTRHDPVSWNTIANLHAGDAAIIYGIAPQDLTTFAADGLGVPGFQGLTLRTFQGGGAAYLTLAGYSTADLSNGRLLTAVGTAPDGSSYLLVQAH
ncbi:MAG: DUF1929 domain-containing protein [Acetobacteraceae bacterium]|nr:DUF1929 domain-containing protein [Acetobacteraceae bacterium]